MAEQPDRPLVELAVAEDRDLDDPDQRTGRAHRDDDIDDLRGARPRRKAHHDRDHQEEQQLLGIDETLDRVAGRGGAARVKPA